jgi:acetyl-CoA synthetase
MPGHLTREQLLSTGVDGVRAGALLADVNRLLEGAASRPEPAAEECWAELTRSLLTADDPFALHKLLYERVYAGRDPARGPAPAWFPTAEQSRATNLHALMRDQGMLSFAELFHWSAAHRTDFWQQMVERLGIRFAEPAAAVADLTDLRAPRWFPGARLNVAESCFGAAPDAVAIVHQAEGGPLRSMSYGELRALAGRVANGLRAAGLEPGAAVAACLPMTAESVAIYLGTVAAGCALVSIADSFAAEEIAVRLQMTGARALFTQDHMVRGGKPLPLYEKVVAAGAPRAIVLAAAGGQAGAGGEAGGAQAAPELRPGDLRWEQFLSADDAFSAVPCDPAAATNILFSSGTTGEPKAIPWTHTTPVKCAADGCLHQDIRPGDVAAWPTSLGWMMGPWLIYASLINRATIALFDGVPTGREFGQFVQDAGVTMLGVVPSLVRTWRGSGCMEGLDWSGIRAFSSTGEPSNGDDYLYLMALAGYRPVIEYCGGTEIGGSYITGTVVHPSAPTTCTTPALGIDFLILDDAGRPASNGEVFLRPPSVGLSTTLLNQDHHAVYFDDTPQAAGTVPLRRHGDQIEQLSGGGYRIHGRVDDTMNLGGIKVSSAEIERVLNTVAGVAETAAVGVPPAAGGPSRLVIYAVLEADTEISTEELHARFRQVIREHLNPLFRIHDVVLVDALPRTASNKTMRRVLRASYAETAGGQVP